MSDAPIEAAERLRSEGMMTLKDFFLKLECCGGEWSVSDEGYIIDSNNDCPIWAVYRSYQLNDEWPDDLFQAGARIGLSYRQVEIIMRAADNDFPRNNRVRRRLVAMIEAEAQEQRDE